MFIESYKIEEKLKKSKYLLNRFAFIYKYY